MNRKICVVTSSRADYGLLQPIIQKLRGDSDLESELVVTGTHLSERFGKTVKEIEEDGFGIDRRIPILDDNDSSIDIAKSMSKTITDMAHVLDELKPDLLIVLGDRFETLGTAIAAHLLRIPIGHIHGGEISEGMMDEGFRHSITKFSHLHFVSTREYAMRVIQLGEDPKRVFVVGSLGVERLLNMKFIERAELELHLNLKFSKKNILITFHPVTLESKEENEGQFRELLKALDKLSHTTLIFTFPNMDIGSSGVAEMIKNYVMTRPRAYAFSSLGQARYFSLMKIIDVVVGNSSSGVIEAPSLKKPTINIGDRQAGRIKASSVIDCQATESDINRALEVAFSNEFQQKVADVVNPYEKPGTSLSILEKIKTFPLEDILKKRFVDLKSI